MSTVTIALACLNLAVLLTGVLTVAAPAREPPPPLPVPVVVTASPTPVPVFTVPRPPVLHTTPPAPLAKKHVQKPYVPRASRFRDRVMLAVDRIPGYNGGVTWVVTSRFGHWGVTDLDTQTVYISPYTPRPYVYSIVVHEWGHIVSVRDYDGDWHAMTRRLNEYFGNDGLGRERAADCIARILGATWTNYTSCTDPKWRHGALELLAGRTV
jgi:hypothetical protein